MRSYFQFLPERPDPSLLVFGEYEPWLVILSIIVAIFTSSVALETARYISKSRSPRIRQTLLVIGSITMGGGVWAMHFIGMLAFKICGSAGYDVTITLLSMIPSIFASGVALKVLSNDALNPRHLIISGVLIGIGIGSMHYSGMAAMLISSRLYYDPWLFALSILVAVGLSILGVWVQFGLAQSFPNIRNTTKVLAAGTVLGLAIAMMHYTGMAAAVFVGNPQQCQLYGMEQSSFIAIAVASVTVLIALLSLGFNISLRQRDLSHHLSTERSKQIALLNTTVDGVILIGDQGTILEFNLACEKMFGFSREEVLGQNVKMLMPSSIAAEHDGYLHNYLSTGERKIIGIGREVNGRRKDGRQFPLELSVGEVIDDDRRMFIGVLRDITERKEMEQGLLNAIASAEQAASAKSAFLTNMSHEIRTPMNAIIGFLEIVLTQQLPEEQRKHLSTAHNSAESLLRLLNDILDTAKMDQGAVELEVQAFNLHLLVDEIESVFNISARNKNLDWHVKIDPRVPVCFFGDITRIRQVLTNLIGNAMKFTEQGSVTLSISYESDQLYFAVKDTGIGIPEDKIESIFSPFTQSDASITRRFGGTGLGTCIAKQLVELMGGSISVNSVMHEGSCFKFELPLEAADCKQIPKESESMPLATPKIMPLRILIAEDIDANAELLTFRLKQGRHLVNRVENGRQAVEKIKHNHYDLIFMDIQMPEMDGLTATRLIRKWQSEKRQQPTPIIALSAGAFTEDKFAADEAGVNGYVTKPIQFKKLFAEMERVLDVTPSETDAASAESTGTQVDDEFINLFEGIDRWGDEELYFDQLGVYAREYVTFVEKLQELVEQSNFEEAAMIAHTLRGVSANLSINKLAELLEPLEELFQQQQTDTRLMAEFSENFKATFAQLEKLQTDA